MPHPSERDDSINQAVQSRLSSEQGVNVNYHELRERVRSGGLGDLDRDATWEALSDAVEGFDYDISEGYSAERGTQPQDEQDSARLSGLLGEFEKKFGQPDHWKWGPVGTDDYDYDADMEAGHDSPSGPTPSPMSPLADSRMDSVRSAVDDYQSSMDYGSPDVGMSKSMEYRGMMNQPSSGPRRGRGRMNY